VQKKKKQTKILLHHKSSSFFEVQLKFKFVFRRLAETYAVIKFLSFLLGINGL